jgi:hypothetical protein
MLDLFSKPDPELPIQALTTSMHVVESLPLEKRIVSVRQYMKPSDALPIYNAAIDFLAKNDIPPYSTFQVKSVSPNMLKWCIDSAKGNVDQLCLYMFVKRVGQNVDNPEATYQEWERIYSRSLSPSQMPLGMNLKPRKIRKARGSRTTNKSTFVD